MRIRDSIAERLEACGLYRRAASRWIEVMQRCLDDEDREWIRHHRNQCLKKAQRPPAPKEEFADLHQAAKRLNIVWALRSPMAKHSDCPAKGKRPPSNAFLHDVCLTASPYPAYGSSTGSNSVGPRKRSAAGRYTSDTVPAVVPDGGINALSCLQMALGPPMTFVRRSAQEHGVSSLLGGFFVFKAREYA